MKIGQKFAVEFELPDLKIVIILAVLEHFEKLPANNELLKSFETVGEIREAKLYIYKYRNIHEVCGFILLPMN